jgi:hypothetical protein
VVSLLVEQTLGPSGTWPSLIGLRWRVRAAFRATQLWTLANVGFFLRPKNSFENEAWKFLAG